MAADCPGGRMRSVTAALVSALLSATSVAHAQSDEPVIESGREREILALFSPLVLGQEASPGYRLMNVSVEATSLRVEIVDGEGHVAARLRLGHPSRVRGPIARTPSFAIDTEVIDRGSEHAVRAVIDRVRANDRGDFYRVRAGPVSQEAARARQRAFWLVDGLAVSLLLLISLAGFVIRDVRRSPRWVGLGLLGIVVAGAIARVWISPHTILGAWPWSRETLLARAAWDGPILGWISSALGPIGWLDTVTTLTLVFAIATPAAVYFDAKRLFESDRIALFASAIIAFLPCHLRFSHSEVEFIPSLTLASMAFGLTHTALRDEGRLARGVALVTLVPTLALMLTLRPLNQLFVPLLLAAALWLARGSIPRTRRFVVSGVISVAASFVLAYHFWPAYGENVHDGLDLETLSNAGKTVVSAHNTLVNAWITPPGVTLLAVAGAFVGLRLVTAQRARTAFTLIWLAIFFVAHGYVLPPSVAMQARYHLHLVVPFALLAAVGLDALHERRPRLAVAALAYVAASPLLHAGFIDARFDDQRELSFLERARTLVPRDCTVLEYTGVGERWNDDNARFLRLGLERVGPDERRTFRVVPIGQPRPGPPSSVRDEALAIIADPPECLYYYEGLLCAAVKPPHDPIAPACAAMHRDLSLEPIASERWAHAPYDHALTEGLPPDREHEITVALYRATAPRP